MAKFNHQNPNKLIHCIVKISVLQNIVEILIIQGKIEKLSIPIPLVTKNTDFRRFSGLFEGEQITAR